MTHRADTIKLHESATNKGDKNRHRPHNSYRRDTHWKDNTNSYQETKEKNHYERAAHSGNRPRIISEETTTSFYCQQDSIAHHEAKAASMDVTHAMPHDGDLDCSSDMDDPESSGHQGKRTRHRPRGCRGRGSRLTRSLQRAAERAVTLQGQKSQQNDTESANGNTGDRLQPALACSIEDAIQRTNSVCENIRTQMNSNQNYGFHVNSCGAALHRGDTSGGFRHQYRLHSNEYMNMKESDLSLSTSFSHSDHIIAALSFYSSSSSERSIDVTQKDDSKSANTFDMFNIEGIQKNTNTVCKSDGTQMNSNQKYDFSDAALCSGDMPAGFRFQYHLQSREYMNMKESDSSLSTTFSRSDRSIAAVSFYSSSSSERSIEVAPSYSFSDETEESKLGANDMARCEKVKVKDKLQSLPEGVTVLSKSNSSTTSQMVPLPCDSGPPRMNNLSAIHPIVDSSNVYLKGGPGGVLFQIPREAYPSVTAMNILPPMNALCDNKGNRELQARAISFPSDMVPLLPCAGVSVSFGENPTDSNKSVISANERTRKEREGGSLFSTSPRSFLMGAKKKRRTMEVNEMESILTVLKDDALGIADSGLKWCYRWF